MLWVAALPTTSQARIGPVSEWTPVRPKICSGRKSTSSIRLSRGRVEAPHEEHVALRVGQALRPLVLVERGDRAVRLTDDMAGPHLVDDLAVGEMGEDLARVPFAGRVALLKERRRGLEERDRQGQRPLEFADDGGFVHAAIITNYSFLSSLLTLLSSSFW